MILNHILVVGLGGFLGATCRFAIGLLIKSQFSHPFPAATLVVNALGCLLMGVLFEGIKHHPEFPGLFLFLGVGFLGAFTTYSAFGLETWVLFQNNELSLALINILTNLILSLAAVVFGAWISQTFFHP